MKKSILKSVSVILSVLMIISLSAFCASAFSYEHDPIDNPKAMADIIVNEDAVYGFSPNPESTRLGVYATALDWTDPEQVAAARAQRVEYRSPFFKSAATFTVGPIGSSEFERFIAARFRKGATKFALKPTKTTLPAWHW